MSFDGRRDGAKKGAIDKKTPVTDSGSQEEAAKPVAKTKASDEETLEDPSSEDEAVPEPTKKSKKSKKDRGEGKSVTQKANIATIRVKMEANSMKIAFEILNVISPTKCNFRFKEDGFYIAAQSKPKEKKKKTGTRAHQKCEVEYYFPAASMSKYKCNLLDSLGNVVPKYDMCVCTTSFHHQIKNLKKNNLLFRLDVEVDNRSDYGINILNGTFKSHVPSLEGKNRYPKLTKFIEYYAGSKPCDTPTNGFFDSIMTTIKNNKCEEIEIRHYIRTCNTLICGWDKESDNPIVSVELDNKADNSSIEEDDAYNDACVKSRIYTAQSDWIYKIGKLSPSVLNIYLNTEDSYAPLGLRTCIGAQGTATITMRRL